MKVKGRKLSDKQIFLAGFIIVLLSFVPYLILGVDAIIPYHDQLDGEVIAYMYQAKYLFDKSPIIPEFLNGASKTSLVAPAPLAVLLFRFFRPFAALIILQSFCQMISYIGMYKLIKEITDNSCIAFIGAFLFTYIPFVPVYGLLFYGTPMLLQSLIHLYRGQNKFWGYVYIALFASMSSLVLGGFAWLGIWFLGILVLTIQKKIGQHKEWVIGFGLMLSVYILENLSLIGQILGLTESAESHKSEMVLSGKDFFSTFLGYLKNNDAHGSDNHIWIFYMTCAICALLWIFGKKLCSRFSCLDWKRMEQIRKLMSTILLFIVAICFVAALTESKTGVEVREQLGTLKAFQLKRMLWVLPVFWYVEMALCLEVLWNFKGLFKWFGYGASSLVLLFACFTTLKNSMIKPCIQEILIPDYNNISYADYYAIGVMDQVEAYIKETDHLEKHEYRVASLGIDPAAALYHGFYCVDGYSNNYDLEYKHKFRKVIAPELERNDWLKSYYDDWGNRCYLFFSEIPGYYTIEKNTSWVNNLQLDISALKELGCDYILSAIYIVNSEELNLEWMGERTFDVEDSWYQIFIYKIKDFE